MFTLFNPRRHEKGFTLVELMISMAVIGVLAAIVIPIYLETKDKFIVGATKANLDVIRSALSVYVAGNSRNLYPMGNMEYGSLVPILPGSNLPMMAEDAKIQESSFAYSGDGITFHIDAASTNKFKNAFIVNPTGIADN